MDFIYLFRVLLKRKWIIIFAGIVAAALAYLLTGNEKKTYRSHAQMSTGFTVSDEVKINDNSDPFQADTRFNNVIVTFTSPTVVSLLSYSLMLHDLNSPKPFRQLTNEEKEDHLYRQVDKAEAKRIYENKLEGRSVLNSYDSTEKKLLGLLTLYRYDYKSLIQALSVYRVERTDYIQIDYSSENPELSAYVVNTLFEQFYRYYRYIRSNNSQESIDTLRSLMEKKKQELDLKNALLRGEGPVDIALESESKLGLISTLERDLTDEKNKQINLYSTLRKINQKIATLNAGGSNGPSENDELLVLRKEMNDAYREYLNDGSKDAALLAKYNNLKNQYQSKYIASGSGTTAGPRDKQLQLNELNEQKQDAEIDIQASNTKISSIETKIGLLKGNVISSASKGATVESINKEVELANNEYLAAKQKYNDAIDINTSSVNNFRQVLYGQPAIEPEPSKRKMIIGLAGISASITTILIIVLLTYLDSSIKTPTIFSKVVGLKMISMINFMNLKNKPMAQIITDIESDTNIPDYERGNIFRESLRKLRYEIESSGKKIFLFTSTKKGMGKTTLIQALSYSMSLSKQKILIIDTNFCNNDLTVQLNATPVLEKIHPASLDGGNIISQVKSYAQPIGDEHTSKYVFAIGSEGGDYTPSEILPKENILHHLKELTQEYDYIFLEGPPLNDFSDSKELARYVEGIIAVFSARHIMKQIDKESARFFKEEKEKFSGAILNMVNLENVNVT